MSQFVEELAKNSKELNKYIRYNVFVDDVCSENINSILPVQIFDCAVKNPKTLRIVSNFIKSKLEIQEIPIKYFEKNFCKILFIPTHALEQLMMYVGIIIIAEKIKKVVDKKNREELIENIGEDMYEFAIKRASLYRPRLAFFVIPEKLYAETLYNTAKNIGKYAIECCMAGVTGEITKRLILKFPKQKWTFSHIVDSSTKERLFSFFNQLLKKELKMDFEI